MIVAGYFNNLDKAAQAAATLDTRKAGGIYLERDSSRTVGAKPEPS